MTQIKMHLFVLANIILPFCLSINQSHQHSTANTKYSQINIFNCSAIPFCATCNRRNLTYQCLSCQFTYQLIDNVCQSNCGDGNRIADQACDDGNLINNDGCSSVCLLQSGFYCIDTNYTDKILSKCNPCSQSCNYCLNYSNCNNCSLESVLTTNNSGVFCIIKPYTFSSQQKSFKQGNNRVVRYVDQSQSTTTDFVKYFTLVLSILSLILFLIGYFTNKIIGLQLIAIYQLTYFSLTEYDTLSSTFISLQTLTFSNAYNPSIISTSTITENRFYLFNFSLNFINNYNLTALLIIVPLLLSLAFSLYNKFKHNLSDETLKQRSQKLKGEITYNSLMFSAYSILVPLLVMFKYIGNMLTFEIVCLVFGCLFAILMLVYAVLINKVSAIFGEFTDHITKVCCEKLRYYTFIEFQRLITSIVLVFAATSAQSAIIAGILGVQLIFVCVKRPYIESGGNLRPVLNLITSIMIQLLIFLSSVLGSNVENFSYCVPFVLMALLATALIYNIVFFVKEVKRKIFFQQFQKKKITQQERFIITQRMQMKSLMDGLHNDSFNNSAIIRRKTQNQLEEEDRNHRQLLTIRERLDKIKESTTSKQSIPIVSLCQEQIPQEQFITNYGDAQKI